MTHRPGQGFPHNARTLAAIGLGVGLIYAGDASAQAVAGQSTAKPTSPSDSVTIEDIVVTAQRREERLQDVPIAVTAVTAATLTKSGVTNSTDLAQSVAGLTISNNSGYVQPRLRGIGNNVIGLGFEGGVATYIDGVYIGSAPGSLMSLSNIERVEVLKGPQGTLFGRNSTGGLIQIVTREPSSDPGGEVTVGFGNYGTYTAEAYATTGLGQYLSADIAGSATTMTDGYGTNVRNGQDVYKTNHDLALRSSLLFKRDDTKVRLSADVTNLVGSMFTALRPAPGATVYFPIRNLPDTWDIDADLQPLYKFRGWGAAATIDQDAGAVHLKSISAFRRSRMGFEQDTDGTGTPGLNIHLTQTDRQYSQEFQVSSGPDSKITWVGGVYYYYAKGITDPTRLEMYGSVQTPIPGFGTVIGNVNNASTKTEALAGFAQATIPLTDKTGLTVGYRYSTEKRSLDSDMTTLIAVPFAPFPIPNHAVSTQSKRFSDPTWRISLDHHFTDDVMGYLSYNRGFKSGGYNAALASEPPYDPETLDAYEAGIKSTLADRRLRLNVSGFYYDYKDIQVGGFSLGQIYYYNGARAHVYGLEADFDARVSSALRLSGGVTLLHDEFVDFPNAIYFLGFNQVAVRSAKGNRLPQTARLTGNIAADYTVPTSVGPLNLNLSYAYNSGYFTEVDNQLHQPSFGLLNASAGLSLDNGLTLRAWGRNLTNEKVTNSMNSTSIGSTTTYQPPRTYGVTVSAKF